MPRRIHQAYQARLEVNGLWTAPAEESEVEKPKRFGEKEAEKDDPKQKFKSAFQRERVGTQVILQPQPASFALIITGLGKVARGF